MLADRGLNMCHLQATRTMPQSLMWHHSPHNKNFYLSPAFKDSLFGHS